MTLKTSFFFLSDKILTIAFDCMDSTQINIDLAQQEKLLEKSLDLIECTVEVCSLRIHVHAKRIINFLIRLIYLYSHSVEDSNSNGTCPDLIQRALSLIQSLFTNDLIKQKCYEEFGRLQSENDLNPIFRKFIKNI